VQIRALKWTPTDGSLVSCGADGSVYEWAAVTGQRAGEVVTKETHYADVALMADGKAYGVGSDGQIKEINGSTVCRLVWLCRLVFLVVSRKLLMPSPFFL
jgi:hypothetical protein